MNSVVTPTDLMIAGGGWLLLCGYAALLNHADRRAANREFARRAAMRRHTIAAGTENHYAVASHSRRQAASVTAIAEACDTKEELRR